MRLFVAVDLPDAVKDQLESLRSPISGANWVRRPAFHMTLHFLGDGISNDRLDDIRAALATVTIPAFEMRLRGVGQFQGRVLWAGVDAPPTLATLHTAAGDALRTVGFPPDKRRFDPHITLARLRDTRQSRNLDPFMRANADFATLPFEVTAFTLFSSQLTQQGPIYTQQATYRLDATAS